MNFRDIELAKSVIDWWEDARYEEVSTGDGDWDNLFYETPDFVIKAKELLKDYGTKK